MLSTFDQQTERGLNPTDLSARRLVLEVARALVAETSHVTVDVVDTKGIRTLRVRTNSDGVGRLVGSQGRTVRAIRTIVTAFASKAELVYALDIGESDGNEAL